MNHGFGPETRSYNWYQSHGARFSKSNRLLSHMCSRSVILVIFVQEEKLGENEKNSDLNPNIQICAETSVGILCFSPKYSSYHHQKSYTKCFYTNLGSNNTLCS
ncbi:hypothetical protein HanXRQr2_Chr10g0463651 [Helianthus annuus]|uniref:Uncharacterized protein n=1 Tax=Helianthus annuus TaxID=4232 RepID=A0A9K3N6A6_HELAN|nr:hypothetical protein HanXRQr2_Chr10g0463651 [Helianthus annuus]KAJ0885642.1 hypothetical protein HanPSC8_Chr10g0447451 [Helianthus annuus]